MGVGERFMIDEIKVPHLEVTWGDSSWELITGILGKTKFGGRVSEVPVEVEWEGTSIGAKGIAPISLIYGGLWLLWTQKWTITE